MKDEVPHSGDIEERWGGNPFTCAPGTNGAHFSVVPPPFWPSPSPPLAPKVPESPSLSSMFPEHFLLPNLHGILRALLQALLHTKCPGILHGNCVSRLGRHLGHGSTMLTKSIHGVHTIGQNQAAPLYAHNLVCILQTTCKTTFAHCTRLANQAERGEGLR